VASPGRRPLEDPLSCSAGQQRSRILPNDATGATLLICIAVAALCRGRCAYIVPSPARRDNQSASACRIRPFRLFVPARHLELIGYACLPVTAIAGACLLLGPQHLMDEVYVGILAVWGNWARHGIAETPGKPRIADAVEYQMMNDQRDRDVRGGGSYHDETAQCLFVHVKRLPGLLIDEIPCLLRTSTFGRVPTNLWLAAAEELRQPAAVRCDAKPQPEGWRRIYQTPTPAAQVGVRDWSAYPDDDRCLVGAAGLALLLGEEERGLAGRSRDGLLRSGSPMAPPPSISIRQPCQHLSPFTQVTELLSMPASRTGSLIATVTCRTPSYGSRLCAKRILSMTRRSPGRHGRRTVRSW
jgi:hypothetical protein